jgi:hypothetical protein
MVLGAALLLTGHAGAWLLALALASRLKTGSRGGDVIGAFILHGLIVTVIVLIAGSAGMIGPAALTGLGITCGGIGAALGGVSAARRAWASGGSVVRELWAESAPVTALCLVGLTAIVVRHGLNAWFFVPYSADELEYHLPKLAHWIQTGGLHRPDTLDTRTFFPAGQQLIQVWWVGILRHDAFIEGASLESAALAMISVAVLSRRLGATRPGGLLAGVVFGSMPVVLLHGTCALNDLTAAALVAASFALLSSPPHVIHAMIFAAIALTIGAGVKPTVMFTVPGFLLLSWPAWRRRVPSQEREKDWVLTAMLAIAAMAGSYWYLVNAVEHGNPFYPVPVGKSASSRISLGESTVVGGPTPTRMIKSIADLWGRRIWRLDGIHNPMIPNQAGWGIVILAVGIPAAGWMVVRRPAARIPAAAFALSMCSVFLLVEFDTWNGRFVMWLPGLLAAAAGVACVQPRVALVVSVLSIAGGAENLRQTAVPGVFATGGDAMMAALSLRERDSWHLVLPSNDLPERAFFESSEPALCIAYNFPAYPLARGDYRRAVHTAVLADPMKILERMDERNCRWLVVLNVPDKFRRAAESLVECGNLKRVARGFYERMSGKKS